MKNESKETSEMRFPSFYCLRKIQLNRRSDSKHSVDKWEKTKFEVRKGLGVNESELSLRKLLELY